MFLGATPDREQHTRTLEPQEDEAFVSMNGPTRDLTAGVETWSFMQFVSSSGRAY
jgi:hypothetical protein